MRKLIAALACRSEGSRLYGKPLQNLDIAAGVTILDHQISLLQTLPCVEAIVLGVSQGAANAAYAELAHRRGVAYLFGDPKDVLQRLIDCAHQAQGTDVFRITTESPFFYYERVAEAWAKHLEHQNDVTTIDGLPEGSHFEIYTLAALEKSHALGEARHRSELCSLYIREHRADFKLEVLDIPAEVARLDLRLTVDYPEDLIVCRAVYQHFKAQAPCLPLAQIASYLDLHPEFKSLVAPFVVPQRLW